MEKPSVKCALLATMITKHKWGTPITEEALLSLSAMVTTIPLHVRSLLAGLGGR